MAVIRLRLNVLNQYIMLWSIAWTNDNPVSGAYLQLPGPPCAHNALYLLMR